MPIQNDSMDMDTHNIQTIKPMSGTWTLTAPDGRQWKADCPLRAVRLEMDERVPPDIQVARVLAAIDSRFDKSAAAAEREKWAMRCEAVAAILAADQSIEKQACAEMARWLAKELREDG